jgi:Domain of unknown function (DUF4384)
MEWPGYYDCGDSLSGREVFVLKATCVVLLLGAAAGLGAQPGAPGSVRPGLEISLERKLPDGKIQTMASDHVFDTGDVVHFRVQSEFDGYLYVMDQGTSGRFATVFPTAEAGADNRVRKGQSFSIPAMEGSWYEIGGPPGFDVLYFLLSPEPLSTPLAGSFAMPGPVSSLVPRCNDAVFRARGECTDVTAGPAALPKDAPLPAPLVPLAGMASRDITIVQKKDGVTVAAKGSTSAPVIYTFRMAHK